MSEEMTKEQARDTLRNAAWLGTNEDRERIEKAVELLCGEQCEDAISRQAALDCLKASELKEFDFIMDARSKIADLPSVQPIRSRGHWIFEEGDGKTCFDGYVCSACNKSFHTHVPYFAEYEFCPHCGADMRESEGQA